MHDVEYCRLHATMIGRVQGVNFRYFVIEQAGVLNLCGWVRNRWNGSVEVCVEGPRSDLEELLIQIRQGPPMARVDDICFEWQPYKAEFKDFQLRSTC